MASIILCPLDNKDNQIIRKYADWLHEKTQHVIIVDERTHLPLAEADVYLTKFEPAIIRLLKQRETKAMVDMLEHLPLLPGEILEKAWFTALTEELNTWIQGTLVYIRTTNQGTLAFIILDLYFDLATGLLNHSFAVHKGSWPKQREPARTDMDPMMTLLDMALQFSTAASCAIPKIGTVVSGGISFLDHMWKKYIVPEELHMHTPTDLKQTLSDVLTQHDIQRSLDNINTYYQWFCDTYSDAERLKGTYLDEIMKTFLDIISPNYSMQKDLGILSDNIHAVAGLSVFTLGASFEILAYKIYFLYRTAKDGQLSAYLSEMLNMLQQYINLSEQTIQSMENNINNRLGKVGTIYRYFTRISSNGCEVPEEGYAFEDREGSTFHFPKEPMCPPPGYNAEQAANDKYNEYVSNLRWQLIAQYYDSEEKRNKAFQVLQHWKDTHQKLNDQWNEYLNEF